MYILSVNKRCYAVEPLSIKPCWDQPRLYCLKGFG